MSLNVGKTVRSAGTKKLPGPGLLGVIGGPLPVLPGYLVFLNGESLGPAGKKSFSLAGATRPTRLFSQGLPFALGEETRLLTCLLLIS